MPFKGEIMRCVMCQKEEKVDPHRESQWRSIDWGVFRFYACPSHFPVNGADAEAFEAAYTAVFERIQEVLKGRGIAGSPDFS